MADFYCEQVLSGQLPVRRILETDRVLAFHHTRPAYPLHIIVIPKEHIESFVTLDDNKLLLEMLQAARQIASEITRDYGACRLVTNMGDYQDSKHLHWHIISGNRLESPAS